MQGKRNNAGISIPKIIIIVVLSIIIILSLTVNIIFMKGNKTYNLLGRTFFIMESNEMQPEIMKGSMIFTDKTSITDLEKQNVVLYKYKDNDSYKITISRIQDIITENGNEFYVVKGDSSDDSITIAAKDVIAKCNEQSRELGWTISAIKSMWGIAALLILPCVILIFVIVFSGIKSKKYDEYDSYDIPVKPEKSKNSAPLFEPNEDINSSETFIEKKNSISDNFSKKRIEKNTPYQMSASEKKKAKREDAQKKILFDVNNDENVENAKRKASERLSSAENLNKGSGFSTYKMKNEESMTRYDSMLKKSPDPEFRFVAESNDLNSIQKPKENIDEKAAAIKLALHKTTSQDATMQNNQTIKESEPLQQPDIDNSVVNQTVNAASNNSMHQKSMGVDEVKSRYINKNENNLHNKRTTKPATFDELMKVIDDEKKKLN